MIKSLLKATLFFCCVFSSYYGKSQTYTLTTSNGTYSDLVSPNVLDESNPDIMPSGSSSFALYQAIPIGFDFEFLGVTYDSIRIAQYGFAQFSSGGTAEALILTYDCRLDYFQGDSALSAINYTLEGAPGSQIFKVEFNNYGFEEDSMDQYFANFQLWLFEDCNEFETHVGPSSVTSGIFLAPLDEAPLMGYISLATGGESAYLEGNSSSPSLVTTSSILSDHPSSGTVYNFSDCQVGLEENLMNANVLIYPNPAAEFITIDINSVTSYDEVIIRDIQGVEVRKFNIENSSSPIINIAELPAAVYFLEVKSADGMSINRFVKK